MELPSPGGSGSVGGTAERRRVSVARRSSTATGQEIACPRLVVFSGGTAFNSLAGHLRQLTTRVAHVLPVSDDGGSTAEIVRVLGGPAVGDIRSRCLRLADDHGEEVRGRGGDAARLREEQARGMHRRATIPRCGRGPPGPALAHSPPPPCVAHASGARREAPPGAPPPARGRGGGQGGVVPDR
jgi:hypothetical protein